MAKNKLCLSVESIFKSRRFKQNKFNTKRAFIPRIDLKKGTSNSKETHVLHITCVTRISMQASRIAGGFTLVVELRRQLSRRMGFVTLVRSGETNFSCFYIVQSVLVLVSRFGIIEFIVLTSFNRSLIRHLHWKHLKRIKIVFICIYDRIMILQITLVAFLFSE